MNEQISAYLERNWLELAGVATGIVCVYYNARQNVWGWVWSLVSVGIYFVIFLRTKLYADAGLQVFFFVVSGYGIYEWRFGGENRTVLPVSRFPTKFILPTLLAGLAFWVGLSWVLHRYTDAALPYLDSALTTVSLVAQWMLARKYLENWLLWIGADVVYVGMYAFKDLYWTAFLYFVYLGLATMGYLAWRRNLSELLGDPARFSGF